jgi:multidrug efflux system membrane fusion protein
MDYRIAIKVFLILSLVGCSQKMEPPKEKIIPVLIMTLKPQDCVSYLEGHGTLTPTAQANICSQVSGRVSKIYSMEGENIQKGNLLAEVDPTLYRLKLQETEASLAQKRAQLEFAKKKLTRYLSIKKENMAALDYDLLQQEVDLHAASVLADEARVQRALIDLENCSIRAPISGKMGKSSIQEEAWISVGTNLGTIRNIDSLYIEFSLSESELSQLPKKSILEMRLPSQEEWNIQGELIALDNQIDLKSGTVQAKGLITNKNHTLWSGQFVQLRLLLEVEKDKILLPIQAIQQNAQGKFVYVIDEQQIACERPIELGAQRQDQMIVLSGLKPEDKIVIKGQIRLYPGAKVVIFKEGESTTPP